MPVDEFVDTVGRELVAVWEWRRDEALRAGLSEIDAELYAHSDADAGLLRHLVADGCPASLIARIL